MANEEWGTKRVCPKCSARFYDLKKEPITCIECGTEFVPEPVLKSKQPVAAVPVAEKPKAKPDADDDDDDSDDETKGLDLGDDDIEVEESEDDDRVLGDVSLDDDDADLSDVVKPPSSDDD